MREPIYKSRPVEPNPARFGGERINDFIVMSEAFSNAYLIETAEGNVQLNAGMGMEAPVIEANFKEFNQGPLHTLIFTQGHVDHVGVDQNYRNSSELQSSGFRQPAQNLGSALPTIQLS